MAYSKMRGARKMKPHKQDETQKPVDSNVQDAFQETGNKLIEQLVNHPYFILGSLVAVIVIVALSMFISKNIDDSRAEKSSVYTKAVATWNSEVGEDKDFASESAKMQKAIQDFTVVTEKLSGTIMADTAYFYLGKAHYRLNEYGKAADFFKKAQNSSNLSPELKFGAYEGEAFSHFDRGDYETAFSVWKKYEDSSATLFKDYALYYMGLCMEKSGKSEKAKEFYLKLRENHPQSSLISKVSDKIPAPETKKEKKG